MLSEKLVNAIDNGHFPTPTRTPSHTQSVFVFGWMQCSAPVTILPKLHSWSMRATQKWVSELNRGATAATAAANTPEKRDFSIFVSHHFRFIDFSTHEPICSIRSVPLIALHWIALHCCQLTRHRRLHLASALESSPLRIHGSLTLRLPCPVIAQ